MRRRLVVASAIAGVVTAALLFGSGVGSSAAAARGTREIPAGLAAAIHARFGPGAIRTSSAASPVPGPVFGYAIALSADGTTALVGAAGVDGGKGAAYVFHVSDAGSWSSTGTPTAVLTNKHGYAGDLFGLGVALSTDGTTAFVTADDGGSGAAYVFHVSAASTWASTSTPTATLTGLEIYSGVAVSTDGTTLVVGAPFYNESTGRAAVFHVSSESAWVSSSSPTAFLLNGIQSGSDGTGYSVAISGDGTTVLVSDSGNSNGGGAYLFHVASESSWTSSGTPTATLSDHTLAYGDGLGNSVALSGDGTVAFLSAPTVDSDTGEVDVFRASGEDAWASTSTPAATLTNAGGSGGDDFGTRLSVSSDGTTALVTGYGVDGGRGAAFIFHVASEGAWASTSAPTATLTSSGAHADDEMGAAALSGDGATALGGAPFVLHATGAAYVFHVADAGSWASSSAPNATLTVKALAACTVPKLKGLKLSAAKQALAAGRCRLGTVTKVHARTKSRGRVVSQSKKPGTRLAIGAKVAVKVGK